ncbi:hypothetical protein [Streptomyces laurentii]|uniref:hypothetical protein n=1 Tax=Streptomyces laurentii TaxID=39478 RepID=UPI0033EE7D8A
MKWFEQAEEAERRQDGDTAITWVSAHAECSSDASDRHGSHLWHLDLLARADRLPELAERATTCVHARRRLNRALRERGMEAALRERADDGDRHALYVLLRLLGEAGRIEEARRVVEEVDPDNAYARKVVADHGAPESGTR